MKTETADSLLDSIKGLGEEPKLRSAHLHNALALVKKYLPREAWIGLYLYDKDLDSLLLGPFMGTPACEKIAIGRGVVGESYNEKEVLFVEDVQRFKGYICCDSTAASELAIPLVKDKEAIGILDVDYPKGTNLKKDQEFFAALADELIRFIA